MLHRATRRRKGDPFRSKPARFEDAVYPQQTRRRAEIPNVKKKIQRAQRPSHEKNEIHHRLRNRKKSQYPEIAADGTQHCPSGSIVTLGDLAKKRTAQTRTRCEDRWSKERMRISKRRSERESDAREIQAEKARDLRLGRIPPTPGNGKARGPPSGARGPRMQEKGEASPMGATPYPPTDSSAVLSATAGLTAGFGMGPGDPRLHGRAHGGCSPAGTASRRVRALAAA